MFCTAKETINKMKTQPTEWKNIFADTSGKRLISNIYKILIKSQLQKNQTIQLKNRQRT